MRDGGPGFQDRAGVSEVLRLSQMHVSRLIARSLGYLRPRLLDQQDRPGIAAAAVRK